MNADSERVEWPTVQSVLATQLFRLVFAMTALRSCSMRLLLHEGQEAAPLSRSFRLRAKVASFPQSRHLYSYIGMGLLLSSVLARP